MNIIAIDIGNTNISFGLFLDGRQDSIISLPGGSKDKIQTTLKQMWGKIPVSKSSSKGKREGVIVVSSVKPDRLQMISQIVKEQFDEKIYIIGKQIPLPIHAFVDEPAKVGTDRIITAAAAFDVVGSAVVVADLGTAVTIDLVDDHGTYQGGVILPGFEISAQALHEKTAQLPKINVTRPNTPFGKNTAEAINCGLYYSVIGALEEVVRRYAEHLGRWPQVIITGAAADIIKEDCPFVDNYVPNLVVKGIVLAYNKFIEQKSTVG